MGKEKVITVEVPYIGPDNMSAFSDLFGVNRNTMSDKYKKLVREALPKNKIFVGFVSSKSKRPDSYQFKVKVLPRKGSSKYAKV